MAAGGTWRTAPDRATALLRRTRERLKAPGVRARAPIAVVLAAVGAWVVVMGRLIVMRHRHFSTFDFDTGIYDQYLWQAAHGRTANTVRGISFFGHHAQLGLLLMVPLVWLGGGPPTWDVLHTIALASTAVPLFLLTRDKLGQPWIGVGVAVVWLANPTVQWLVHEGFHPEGMALPFLVGTYLFGERLLTERRGAGGPSATRRSQIGFVACFLMAIVWKEDVALALIGMALVWVIRREWRFGLRVGAVALAWFVIFGMLLVPHIAGGSAFGGIYDLGSTPTEIVVNSAKDPTRLIDKLDENNALGNAGSLAQPFGFVPVLSPSTLLIGLPQWSVNIVSASSFTWSLRFHYQAIPTAALAIALVEGLRRLLRWQWLMSAGIGAALAFALLATLHYGPSPASDLYRVGFWPHDPSSNLQAKRIAVAHVPPSAGVTGDYLMVPQLSQRETVYTFPNPWRSSNWGAKPGQRGDPGAVDWIVLDMGLLGEADTEVLETIRSSGEFELRFERDGVIVLERVAAPGAGSAPIDVG